MTTFPLNENIMVRNTEEEDVVVKLGIKEFKIDHHHFPPILMGTFWYNPHGLDGFLSYARIVIEDGDKSGEPNPFYTFEDIIHVDAPSSMDDDAL